MEHHARLDFLDVQDMLLRRFPSIDRLARPFEDVSINGQMNASVF
jgi:hypothetical protein